MSCKLKEKMMDKSVTHTCPECESEGVEEQCWVRINDSKIMSNIEGRYWCPDCMGEFKYVNEKEKGE